jgi:hypothetical protein
MVEPRDSCHEVTLPSGEPIRVRGAGEMSPEAVAALGELVDAARRMHAASHPPNLAAEALWARLNARADASGIRRRDAAHEAGVRPSVVVRIGQGIMPDETDLAAIERWIAKGDSNA